MTKIIQSFWCANQDFLTNNFGWHSPKFHAIGWALSCLQLKKFYDVELYTDKLGYDFLINKLKLPYSKVHVVLDDLNTFHKDFWALPKIKSYMLQSEPFLHVDGDVFIWEEFNSKILNAGIITQNLEITTEYYKEMWEEIYPNLEFIPSEMSRYISSKNNFACNMGVFGGNDLDFIQKYSQKSYEFAKANYTLPQKVSGGNFNIFFEQVLLYEMLLIENKESDYILDDISLDNEYIGFGNFDEVPFNRTYLHLLGFYKRVYSVCKLMESYFILNYPYYFEKIKDCFSDDYAYFNNITQYSFSIKENISRINFFIEETKKDSYPHNCDDNYLFNRDLTCITLHGFLFESYKHNRDFKILRLKGNHIEEILIEHLESINIDDKLDLESINKILLIKELNDENNILPIDEIDEILLEKFKKETSFNNLLEELLKMLDNDALEMANEFVLMIKERINYYLKNKTILIYQ